MNYDQNKLNRKAIVFYSRDFLATEFPKLANTLDGLAHVYITANQREANQVLRHDPNGEVFLLDDADRWPKPQPELADTGFNRDRFLRNYSQESIQTISRVLQGISQECLRKYKVEMYVDEPVSGYPNVYFNRAFSASGAKCLHFQTAWVPGYMFFTADAAQAAPVEIGWHADWEVIIDSHIENRRRGLAKPAYVIEYGRRRKRIQDVLLAIGKILHRLLVRPYAIYIDRDVSAHWWHVKCLLKSFSSKIYAEELIAQDGERFVLFPLHYEPESVLNYFSEFQRQEEIAAQILDTLPINFRLILKEHPSQPGALGMQKWDLLVRAKRVISVRGEYDSRKLLNLDVVVVSIGSTLALESAVVGRPVGVLGAVHFATMPGIKRIKSPREWLTLLDHQPAALPDIKKWYAEFMRLYGFPGVIMKENTNMRAASAIFKRVLENNF
jgi:hypothetical protein